MAWWDDITTDAHRRMGWDDSGQFVGWGNDQNPYANAGDMTHIGASNPASQSGMTAAPPPPPPSIAPPPSQDPNNFGAGLVGGEPAKGLQNAAGSARDNSLGSLDDAQKALDALPDQYKSIFGPILDFAKQNAAESKAALDAPVGAAQSSLTAAQGREASITGDAMKQYGDIISYHDTQLKQMRDDWTKTVSDYKDMTAQSAQSTVNGMWGNFKQSASDLRAKAESMGVPADQIEGQIAQMKMSTAIGAGTTVGQFAAATNAKLADINTSLTQTYAGLAGQFGAQRVGAYGTLQQTRLGAAAQTLQAETTLVGAQTERAKGIQSINDYTTGMAFNITTQQAHAYDLSANGRMVLAGQRTQVQQQWLAAIQHMHDLYGTLQMNAENMQMQMEA